MKSPNPYLTARFSEDGDLELSGPADQLKVLAQTLKNVSEPIEIVLNKITEVELYEGQFEALLVQPIPGQLLTISQNGKTLVFSGVDHALASLGENIQFLAEEGGDHLHVEYYPQHPFLDPKSSPIVITSETLE